MSAETEFRALLAGNAGVTALVGSRIYQTAAAKGAALPLVAFSASHAINRGLDNTQLDDEVTFEVQCWATSSAASDAIADAINTACGTTCVVTARASGYDDELDLHATMLTVQWFD